MNKRIIIAGGGTGGHIFPAIAIANALRKENPWIKILFVGAKGKMEMEKVPQAGYDIKGIDIVGFNRSNIFKNILLPFKLFKSYGQVADIFSEFNPDAVIGVGGYSSFPVLSYAQHKKLPTFIHESNSFAGKANKRLGKKATRIFVGSDGMSTFFPPEKIMVTGNPVRTSILGSKITREEGIRFFGLDPARKTILSIGGSLGAKSINEAVEAGIKELTKDNLQLIWQTGKPYAARAAEYAVENKSVWANAFINDMEYAYAAADVVISRAGAMAIAELCVMKKPVLFVPYPYAAEDHQTVNAQNLVNKNAGLMIKDSEAKEKLVPSIVALAKDEARQEELRANIGKLAVTNADEVIAAEILKLV
ncbi:MAG TPA: undecaprenyldiphospho-muramoylpentapeptide beta-N-acetylglucosaminyltransferase [Chitinophagaceae bacterium]|nr:undecaprenyldiphospho-muramoylpentapeptide beta-N-acetylglucosaminyltransferase [Chitinophagaceae bacterium]